LRLHPTFRGLAMAGKPKRKLSTKIQILIEAQNVNFRRSARYCQTLVSRRFFQSFRISFRQIPLWSDNFLSIFHSTISYLKFFEKFLLKTMWSMFSFKFSVIFFKLLDSKHSEKLFRPK